MKCYFYVVTFTLMFCRSPQGYGWLKLKDLYDETCSLIFYFQAEAAKKLPTLYLIDSIIKNLPKSSYPSLFAQNIVQTFCATFEKVSIENLVKAFESLIDIVIHVLFVCTPQNLWPWWRRCSLVDGKKINFIAGLLEFDSIFGCIDKLFV